jgi:hypothetical protein
MPWKDTCSADERTRFMARLSDGESMRGLREEFGISRKAGHKVWPRLPLPISLKGQPADAGQRPPSFWLKGVRWWVTYSVRTGMPRST